MPKREITVPVLPKPDVVNINGVLFEGNALKDAIDKYMDTPYRHVMYGQASKPNLEVDIHSVCGSVDDIIFDADTKSYNAIIKLIPNKTSAAILAELDKGIKFSLGTNKVGTLAEPNKVNDDGEHEYSDDVKLVCVGDFDIINTSILLDADIQKAPNDTQD